MQIMNFLKNFLRENDKQLNEYMYEALAYGVKIVFPNLGVDYDKGTEKYLMSYINQLDLSEEDVAKILNYAYKYHKLNIFT